MEADIQKGVEILRAGGVLLYPTDTIWGLGCDASNESAVSRIAVIKKRTPAKSFIVLLADAEQLIHYVKDVPPLAWDLIENSEKPLSIVYEGGMGLAPGVISPDGSVAIRITKDEFCKKLIRKFGKPVVSTSANISSEEAPALFQEIKEELKKQVDYVVRWKQNDTRKSQSSTIIRLAVNGEFKIIRP